MLGPSSQWNSSDTSDSGEVQTVLADAPLPDARAFERSELPADAGRELVEVGVLTPQPDGQPRQVALDHGAEVLVMPWRSLRRGAYSSDEYHSCARSSEGNSISTG